jgi:hypothetical protein
MNELDVKSPTTGSILVTERSSLSVLKEFVEKQSVLLDIQESHFIAASDEIIRQLKAADLRIDESQQDIESLKSQTRSMLLELQASK